MLRKISEKEFQISTLNILSICDRIMSELLKYNTKDYHIFLFVSLVLFFGFYELKDEIYFYAKRKFINVALNLRR